MTPNIKAVRRCFYLLASFPRPHLRRATVYLDPREVVKVTRQHRYDGRKKREHFILTVGAPNYRERAFIKQAQAAGEKFPIRNVQLAWWPKRKKAVR